MRTRPTLRTPRNALALAALMLLQPLSQGALPPFYTVTPVVGPYGPMSGVSINDMGQVLGGYPDWAFLWSRLGVSPILQSGAFSAYGMNNDGTVVGQARLMFDDGPQWVAARWQSGVVTTLASQDSAGRQTSGIAFGINQEGWAVGIHAVTGGPGTPSAYQGTLWSPTNQAQSLGDWSPQAINSQNTVVGSRSVVDLHVPVLWTASGGLQELPLPAGTSGGAGGINALGQVVGSFIPAGGQGGGGGFLWSATDGLQALAAPQGSFASVAAAINDRGQAVGHQLFRDDSRGPLNGGLNMRHGAVLWDSGASAPVNLEPMARMPGGGTLADAGLWLTQAVDVNARGQVLVVGSRLTPAPYSPPGTMTLTNFEAYVLSPCLRCGQILPNPNPAGALLNVGTDWEDAYNALSFENLGGLRLDTLLVNRAGASFTNRGEVGITDRGNWSNDGRLLNERGGRLSVSGGFSNFETASVLNRGVVQVLDGANFALWDASANGGWLNDTGSTFAQQAGAIFNGGRFYNQQATFRQDAAGSFANHGEFALVSSSASFAGTVTNRGRMDLVQDVVEAPGVRSQVAVSGQFQNLAGGSIRMDGGSFLTVEAGGQLTNRGALTLAGSGTQVSVRSGGVLVNEGGTIRLGAGSVLKIGQDAGSGAASGSVPATVPSGPQPPVAAAFRQSGELILSPDAVLEIGQNQTMDVMGGRVSNEGLIVVRGGARINNIGNVQLRAGSTLELAAGASFEQGVGALSVATGAMLWGSGLLTQTNGITTVDGTVALPLSILSGGILDGTGTFLGAVVLAGTLDLRPGHSPGTLTFDGDLTIEDGVTLQLEVADYRTFDRLVVTGKADITALRVAFTPGSGYQPDLNDSFQWLQVGQGVTGLENVVFDNVPAGWELQADTSGRVGLWNTLAEELPEGGVTSFEVYASRLAYLSPLRAGAGYEVASNLWVSGSLAVQSQAILNVRGPLAVEAGGRLSNRGQIEAFEGLRNLGRFENRDDGVLVVRGSAGLHNEGMLVNDGALMLRGDAVLRNEGVLVNRGRLASDGRVTNAAGARFENHGEMTAPWLRNEGQFIVSGSLVLTEGVNNDGRFEVARGGRVDAGSDYIQIDNGSVTPVTRVDGVFFATSGSISISEGILEGSGHIQDTVFLGGDPQGGPKALVRPGGRDAVGTLTVDGLYAGRADFEIDIASVQSFDQLASLNAYFADGEVHFRLLNGFLPAAGAHFSWLSIDPAALPGSGVAMLRWSVSLVQADQSERWLAGSSGYDPTAPLRFSFDGVQLSVSAVPEPGTTAMMLLGLILVSGYKLRKSRLPEGRTGR